MAKKSKRQRAELGQNGVTEKQLSGGRKIEAVRPVQVVPGEKASGEGESKVWPALAIGVLLFLLTIYYAGYDIPFFASLPFVGLATAAAGAMLKWKPTKHFTVTSVLFLVFVVLCGVASLYSDFREIASGEFGKWFSAFWFFAIVVIICKKKHTRTLLLGIAAGIALTAVFGIDSSSWHKLTEFFLGFLLRVDTSMYSYWGDGRISGMFANPNISGSLFALGIFLSLYASRTGKGRAERIVAYSSLAISSMGFLLSFSMGSIGFFIIGVAVYLAASDREERPGLLILMVGTAISTIAFSVIATLGLGKEGTVALVPNLVMVLNCIVIWQFGTRTGFRLSELLSANGRTVGIALGGAAGLAVLYVVLGFNITGGMEMAPGEWVSRSAYPAAGEYSLSTNGVADLHMRIRAQNGQQAAMHSSTILYEGSAADARFTVPEGTKVVYFDMSSGQGGRVATVHYEGPSTGALKLKYLLLPGFAATRIQGFWANQNVIQRFTFFEDALKIWRSSPVFGKGMGAYEAYRPQVADFFYSTRYVHNVYLQVMAETGVAGILLLLGMAASFFVAVLRGRRDEKYGTMAPPLLACLAMMWGHGSFEVIWSSKPYLLVAALILAVVQIQFGECLIWEPFKSRPGIWGAAAAITATGLLFGVLFLLNPFYGIKMRRASQMNYESFMSTVAQAVRINAYESDTYRATYLKNAFFEENEGILQTADGYAARLAEGNTSSYGVLAAEYYLARGQVDKAFNALERSALRGRADPQAWNRVIATAMGAYQEGDNEMESKVRSLLALWKKIDGEQLDNLTLEDAQEQFLLDFER